jgi:hypothetical protein
MGEKRDRERVHVPEQVTGEVTVFQPMTILDLSDTGAQVETTFPLLLEALHDCRLSLGARSVVIKGRIVHCQVRELRDGAVLYRTGIQFVEPRAHARRAIEAFVEAQRAFRRGRDILDAEIAGEEV